MRLADMYTGRHELRTCNYKECRRCNKVAHNLKLNWMYLLRCGKNCTLLKISNSRIDSKCRGMSRLMRISAPSIKIFYSKYPTNIIKRYTIYPENVAKGRKISFQAKNYLFSLCETFRSSDSGQL